jgi:hypothetical protein
MRVTTERCETCGRLLGERHKATSKGPSLKTAEKWIDEGVARATDGCRVEPDGRCEHGHSSWLLVLGLI